MNIFGRVLGGILIFISLAWLARIAQVSPLGNMTNQFWGGQPTTPAGNLTTNTAPGGQRVGTAPLNASPRTAAGNQSAIAQNPAAAQGGGTPGGTMTAQGTPETGATQPVTAAW